MNKEVLEEKYSLKELVKKYSVTIEDKEYILEMWKFQNSFQLKPNPCPDNFGEINWHSTEEDAFDRGFTWFQTGLREQSKDNSA